MGKWRRYKVKGLKAYISDNYIAEVDHYINNDLDLTELYKDDTVSKFNQDVVDRLIKKGEKYVRLSHDLDDVIVTSFGRLINTSRVNQYNIRLTTGSFVVYVRGKKIDLQKIFLDNGWNYDYDFIKGNYDKYKWKYQDVKKYVYYGGKTHSTKSDN